MLVPTLYVSHQVEELRRQDEQRDVQLWRMLRQERPRRRSNEVPHRRWALGMNWVRNLLGSPSA